MKSSVECPYSTMLQVTATLHVQEIPLGMVSVHVDKYMYVPKQTSVGRSE